MADTPNNIQVAAKASNDEALAEMEKEVEATLAKEAENPDSTTEETTPEPAKGETETPAPTSAEGEDKQPSGKPESEETKPESKPDGEQKPAEESKDDDFTDDDVKHLSEKAQKRFKSMSKRIRDFEAAEARRKYEAQPPVVTPAPTPQTPKAPAKPEQTATGLPWDLPKVDGEPAGETPEDQEAKIQKTVQSELKKKEILANIQSDTTYLEEKYPVLNQDSDQYDEVLATKISSWFKAQFRVNNDLRFKDFVEDVMSLRAKGVEQGKSEVTTKVLQQASEQAISPSSTRVEPANVESQIAGATSIKELEELEKSLPQS